MNKNELCSSWNVLKIVEEKRKFENEKLAECFIIIISKLCIKEMIKDTEDAEILFAVKAAVLWWVDIFIQDNWLFELWNEIS